MNFDFVLNEEAQWASIAFSKRLRSEASKAENDKGHSELWPKDF